MSEGAIAAGYAAGLLEVAKVEGQAYEVGSDLALIAQTIGSHLKLTEALSDTGIPAGSRLEIIEDVFKGRISDLALGMLQTLSLAGRVKLIGLISEKYSEALQSAYGRALAEVITAVPLSDSMKKHVESELKRITGKEAVLDLKVDPSILGGIIIRVDGKLIDGSLQSGFAELRQAMVSQ